MLSSADLPPTTHRLAASDLASGALSVGIGAVIAWGAWGEARLPLLAATLPLAIGLAGTRAQAFLIGLAYVLCAERAWPAYMAGWYESSLPIGIALWLACGLIGAIGWSLGWTASARPWRKAIASGVAWIVSLVPPAGFAGIGHPVVAWGSILPGSGWLGVAASLLVPAACLAWLADLRWSHRRLLAVFFPLALVVSACGVLGYQPANTQQRDDVQAVTTRWGAARGETDILQRMEDMGRLNQRLAQQKGARVVIYPESILEAYDPPLHRPLTALVVEPAARLGLVVVLGADLPTREGNFQSVAMAFYPDGSYRQATARQSVPVALWKPWRASGSFPSDWSANNLLPLKDGVIARVIFCYEEYLPLLSLINEAKDPHDLVVVMANTWASQGPLGTAIQAQHSIGMARLFGRPLLRADNRPHNSP